MTLNDTQRRRAAKRYEQFVQQFKADHVKRKEELVELIIERLQQLPPHQLRQTLELLREKQKDT